jgi:hypothetical protein
MTNMPPTDGPDARPSTSDSAVRVLRRWEDSGAVWRVISRSPRRIEISLLTCDAGEEMDRLTSSDPELLDYVGIRDGNDEARA